MSLGSIDLVGLPLLFRKQRGIYRAIRSSSHLQFERSEGVKGVVNWNCVLPDGCGAVGLAFSQSVPVRRPNRLDSMEASSGMQPFFYGPSGSQAAA